MRTDPDPDLAPDRWALDADPEPDPPKSCRSDHIRVHNTVRKYRDTWKLIILWSRFTKMKVIVVPVMRSRGARDSPGQGWPAWPGGPCRLHASWDPPPLPAHQVPYSWLVDVLQCRLLIGCSEKWGRINLSQAASGLILQNHRLGTTTKLGCGSGSGSAPLLDLKKDVYMDFWSAEMTLHIFRRMWRSEHRNPDPYPVFFF